MVERLTTDEHDAMRAIRFKLLAHEPYAGLMSIDDRKDFYDGLCSMRVFEGQLILDYTRPWGTSRG